MEFFQLAFYENLLGPAWLPVWTMVKIVAIVIHVWSCAVICQ